MGIPHSINSASQDLASALGFLTARQGPDVCIEAVGLEQTFVQSVEQVCYAGKVVYIGYAKKPVTYETNTFLLKELDIMGSRGAELLDFQNVRQFLLQDKSDLRPLLSADFPLRRGVEALPYWAENRDKIFKITVSIAEPSAIR